MKDPADPGRKDRPSAASFKVGAIALAFLIIGYQAALFVGHAARLRIEANRDRPDTVYVVAGPGGSAEAGSDPERIPYPVGEGEPARKESVRGPMSGGAAGNPGSPGGVTVRRNAPHSAFVEQYRRQTRRTESFRFDPNTVSVEDLIRLGFSEKQAQSIDNYRTKGGRFRRKADFARSFVVADSVYRRLEPYIDIPRLDLNAADSAALDALPGIGPYFAVRILEYRGELGGFSYPEQLMDLYRFDREKYEALQDLVYCSPPAPYALWTLPEEALARHPYVRSRQTAHAIVLFRDNSPRATWSVGALAAAGILSEEQAEKLARCVLAPP